MRWSELCILTTHEAIEPVSNILHEAGSSGVVIEDPKDLERNWPAGYGEVYDLNPEDYPENGIHIKAYLPVNSYLGETVEQIKEAINNLIQYNFDLGANHVTVTEVNEEDWATAWKKYYKPIKISERVTITPSWENYIPEKQDDVVIELDPGMAFGTGTHPTTVLCLKALEKYLSKESNVLDIGTGSGVLSIAAAKLGAGSVQAVDVDEVAVRSARINAKMNNVHEIVDVRQNDLANGIEGLYDVCLANLLADIVINLTEGANRTLKSGGYLIASGIIQQKQSMVEDHLKQNGFFIQETLVQDDWVAIVAKKSDSPGR